MKTDPNPTISVYDSSLPSSETVMCMYQLHTAHHIRAIGSIEGHISISSVVNTFVLNIIYGFCCM